MPASIFLPEPVTQWLDDDELTLILSAFAADADPSAAPMDSSSSAPIDKTPLIAGSENTADLGDPPSTSTAEVRTPATQDEVDVAVTAEISGADRDPRGRGRDHRRIEPGQVGDAESTFTDDPPPADVPLSLEVKAQPVTGETLLDNNNLTYTVTFK